ncbi:MAG TPA: cation diffusion facilitator family transporter [Solirubrobacteraceae bacterium]|jgi:cation diffusion facilitator family transporter|nr:cation diffusion facilitator family transporter [Solirubrobacteraceae bacterium]
MAAVQDNGQDPGPRRTTLVSIAVAALLVALKLGVGLATHSLGLISAGIESSGDVVAAVLTFFAVRLGGRPADRGHPYGHRRAENLGALGEAAILIGGAILVTVEAVRHLIDSAGAPSIHWYQFAVIGIALVLDLGRTSASRRASRRYDSPALRSNAVHFASDMLGSVAVLAGLLATDAGFHQGDSIAALLVAAIILAAALRLLTENANVLMDRTPTEAREAAERAIAALDADIELSRLRLRESAGRYFADVVVSVPAGQPVVEGHRAADLVEQAVESELPGSDVVVHVEPRRRGLDLRDRVLAIALSEPLVKEAHDIAVFEQGDRASVSLHLKFPDDLDLRSAHEVAERVEQAIRLRPGVDDVQTHLEPLERPLQAKAGDSQADDETLHEVQALVRERTGREPASARLLSTDAGRVLFLTLSGRDGESLTDAHLLTGELEDQLRLRIGDLADVVIHTEP